MTGQTLAAGPLFEVAGFAVHLDVLFTGLVTGLTYALFGAGLVLVYRATRVVNVAHGEIGAFGAMLFALLGLNLGFPFLLAAPLAVVASAAMGAAVEVLVVRRLFRAPRVVLLVAMIGVAQVMLLCSVSLPDINGNSYPTIADWRTTVGGVDVRSQDLTVLIGVPVIVLGLGLWLERTRTGTAVRASADNADAARLAGIPVGTVSTVVWAVAGALAALAALLAAPVLGQSVSLTTAGFGPSLLLRGLAAGLIGNFTSLPRTLAGGVFIGFVDALVIANYPTTAGMSDLVMLVIILLALLVRVLSRSGGGLAGADDSSYTLTPRLAPMPAWTASVPWLRWLRPALVTLAVLVAALIPVFVTDSAPLLRMTTILCFAMVGLSVTVLLGWAGQLSLGQFAFAAVGAVATAVLTTTHGWPFLLALVAAALVGAVVAVVVGTQALRIRGLMLAVATLAFAVAARTWLFGQEWTKTASSVVSVDLGGFPGTSPRVYYLLCLVILLLAAAMVARLRRTGVGRTFIAVRDNPRAAAAMTVSPTRVQLSAFALAGALAALGGALYGGLLVRFTEVSFTPEMSLTAVAMTVVGGLGTVFGAIAGPLWVLGVPLLFGDTEGARLAASGLGLLILLLYLPGGFVGVAMSIRDQLVRLAAGRRQAAGAAPDAPPAPPAPSATAPETAPATAPARATAAPPAAGGRGRHGLEGRRREGGQPPAVLVEDVTVRFGGRTALDGVQLDVRPGEILGLIGPNGAGKSTLLDVISGFTRPQAGRVLLDGADLTAVPPHRRAMAGIGRTFQDARLFGDLTVREAVMVALESAGRTRLLPAALPVGPSARQEARRRREADEVLAFIGLTRYADTFVVALSTGTRRLCELAMMLAMRPRLLLFDEPTAGVAQRDAEAFGPLIRAVRAELDATVVVVEHDVPMLVGMSDRLACLSAGRVLTEGEPAQVIADPRVVEAYLGTDERTVNRSDAPQKELTA